MSLMTRLWITVLMAGLTCLASASNSIHTTYLWHLHQPIYWPDQDRNGGEDRYEVAWGSIQQTDGGATHPENNLREIFGKDDRIAAYQWRTRDSISTLLGLSDGGAQINYSGALMENIRSLGLAGQLGYSGSWNSGINEARGWLTSGGQSRADIVNFTHHHAMIPFLSDRTVWLQIRMHQEMMEDVWGITPGTARGFFPTETCFTERVIPILEDLGIEWSFVSNEHLSRACPDFPVVYGSGGINCDPPNLADQINTNGGNYWSDHIDRGCSPTNAYPLAYTPHRAQYVDPDTGTVSSIVVVPTAQAISWDDGYGSIGASALDGIAAGNDPSRPMLVVLAHDGDNAWGGGYSYYMEAVQNFSNDCASRGYSPSTVNQYLADHPVPLNDIVHVEDGGWVNADSDFGSPTYINWLWPLLTESGQIDPVNGWHYKAREYAIFTAAENRIRTAEDLAGGSGTTRIDHVLDPRTGTSEVERAWNFYLASMDSGNVYYGNPDDMEIKGTVGCNEAFEHVDPILASMNPTDDDTNPTVMIPQRQPYNPGSVSFGAQYSYQQFINDGSFVVWTFAYDVSGIQSATLKYRADNDGVNPLNSTQNETYAGGGEVGSWQSVPMSWHTFSADNPYGWVGLNYFELPTHISEHLSASVPAINESLLDYYVEVIDNQGNTTRTPIQHVWIGDGSGSSSGGDSRVTTDPSPLQRGANATISFDPAGHELDGASNVHIHYGFNNWSPVNPTDPEMSWNATSERWEISLPMASDATQFDCVFNNGAGIWDNNSGSDWHLTVSEVASPTGTALILPNPPTAAESATLTFTVGDGPLSEAASVYAQITYNSGSIVVSFDPLMVFNGGQNQWETTFTVDSAATSVQVTFNDGGSTTDDRNGTKWTWSVNPPLTGTPVLTPNPAIQGENALITYSVGQGPLESASSIYVNIGFTQSRPESQGVVTGDLMTFNSTANRWEHTAAVPSNATAMHLTFNDGAATTDNNNGPGWNYSVQPSGPGAVVEISPNPPLSSLPCLISYENEGRTTAGAASMFLHWGINNWSTVYEPDPEMTFNSGNGRWEIMVDVDSAATELDFVFNNGSDTWDNNDTQDWKYTVQAGVEANPSIALNKSQINASVTEGNDAAATDFTVTNSGGETLDYTIAINYDDTISWVDVRDHLLGLAPLDPNMNVNGDGIVDASDLVYLINNGTEPTWLFVTPASGSSTGEADTIDVTFDSSALAPGTYGATISVSGNAANSPQSIDVTVTITPASGQPDITIGNGPLLGNTAGQDWYEQFQDWTSDDVRALDEPFDTYEFMDGQDRARDIIAFYHRDDPAGGNVYFRVDLFDLAENAEQGSMDLYVAIDFNSPETGQEWLPDFTDCMTDTKWEVCLALYQADAWSIYDGDFNTISNSSTSPGLFLGANYRADLDSVEFGIARSVLTGEGWDGSSPLNFQVFTTRDLTNSGPGEIVDHSDITDAIVDDDRGYSDGEFGTLNGATASTTSVTPLPFAHILHGNQSLNTSANLQDIIYSNSVTTPSGHPTGYHRALDTAEIFNAPPSIHVSATLAESLQWADRPGDTDPQDGPKFNERIASFLDGNPANGEGALVAGVFSEHMMPYFEGANNQLSIDLNEETLAAIYGETIVPGQNIFWVPERVIRGTTFADIAAAGYTHTVLDQQGENGYGHIVQWWGAGEASTNGHKIHRVNGVNFFLINNETDGNKFYPQDDGLNFDLRESFINRALDTDDEQLILAFDDWEAYAGRSFTSFSEGNDNPDSWNRTVRWLANHQWIEMTTLQDIASRGWTPVDHGTDTGLSLQTYDWLMHATHGNYDTWYQGSAGLEEDFDDHHPAIRSDLTSYGDTRIGDIGSAGTIYGDLSTAIAGLGSGNLGRLAQMGWVAAIYETAWHDENEPLESGNPDNTYDATADWALKLNGVLARRVGIAIAAAQWASSSPSLFTGIQQTDLDYDGEDEAVIYNNRVYAVFENDGGRLIAAYARDPGSGTARQVIGCPVANPDFSDEREGADNGSAGRTSCLKDWWASGSETNQYVNDVYTVSIGLTNVTFTSSDGRIEKVIQLADDSSTLEVSYTVDPAITMLYIRNGLSPNVLDLLENGQANLSESNAGGVFTLSNSAGGSVAFGHGDAGHTGTTYNAAASDGSANSPRNSAVTHMIELSGSGSLSFGITMMP